MKRTVKKNKTRLFLILGALGVLVYAVLGVAAWTAVNNPAFASYLGTAPMPTQDEQHWAQVEISKPMVNDFNISAFAEQASAMPEPVVEETAVPTNEVENDEADAPTPAPTDEPSTSAPTETSEVTTPLPEVTETPGEMMMEIVPDTTADIFIPPSSAPKPSVASSGNGTRWIDVDLTNQRVYAYEGETIVNSFIVSTGTWLTPTVTGEFKIYVKYRSSKMSGPGYYLPDVPYIMYFHGDYGLHGTYWHNNFGTPMSHGCVNLKTEDAGWLYDWSSVGTVVNVHY